MTIDIYLACGDVLREVPLLPPYYRSLRGIESPETEHCPHGHGKEVVLEVVETPDEKLAP